MNAITDSIEHSERQEREEVSQTLVSRAQMLLSRIQFPGYTFSIIQGHGGAYVQGEYLEPDIHSNQMEKQFTRKWLLSPQMTNSEIVATAFKLCLTSAEHRTREAFTYRGQRIFGPHFDVEDLVKVCADGRGENGGRRS